MLWVLIPFRARSIALCHKACRWLATGRWFSLGTPVSPTNKTDDQDTTEILLKVALNTIKPTPNNRDLRSTFDNRLNIWLLNQTVLYLDLSFSIMYSQGRRHHMCNIFSLYYFFSSVHNINNILYTHIFNLNR